MEMSFLFSFDISRLTYLPFVFFGCVQADEDPVDPMPKIREACLPTCPKESSLYDACKQRIAKSGEGDWEAWYFDLHHCVDKCVTPKIFAATKGG